jgi:hypothetical protein
MKRLVTLFGILGAVFTATAAHAMTTDQIVTVEPAFASVAPDATGWVRLSSVCFSNSNYDSARARAACETSLQTLNLLTNDKMVFQGDCQPQAASETCSYGLYSGYVLHAKALLVDPN